MYRKTLLISIVSLVLFSASTFAAIPRTINFQGRLVNNGVPASGTGQITFKIYNIPSNGTSLWTETDNVSFDSGVFSVPLGAVTPLNLDFNQSLWVEMTYSGTTLVPRQALITVPYAFSALTAETVINGGVPIGTVLASASSITPEGYLECAGQSVATASYPNLFTAIGYTYGGTGANFNVPDYRGFFLRGWNRGASVDPDSASRTIANGSGTVVGNVIGSRQGYQIQSHNHAHYYYDQGYNGSHSNFGMLVDTSAVPGASSSKTTTDNTGGNETRPVNAYVMYIIRAQ